MPKRKRTYTKARRRTRRRTGRYSRISKPAVRTMIKKALAPHTQTIRLFSPIPSTNISESFNGFQLNPIQNATRIFGTDSNDMHANQAKHVRMDVDFVIRRGSEHDGVQLTVYIVSPHNNCRDDLFDSNTGSLSLIANRDYSITGGIAFVNPQTLKIHKRWKIGFPPGAQGEVVYPMEKRKSFSFRPNNLIKNKGGDFSTLRCPYKPTHNYFMLIFNNNSAVDIEFPNIYGSIVNTYIA